MPIPKEPALPLLPARDAGIPAPSKARPEGLQYMTPEPSDTMAPAGGRAVVDPGARGVGARGAVSSSIPSAEADTVEPPALPVPRWCPGEEAVGVAGAPTRARELPPPVKVDRSKAVVMPGRGEEGEEDPTMEDADRTDFKVCVCR